MGTSDACEENKLSQSFSPPPSSSIVPLTPDPNRGNGEQRPEFSSPLTVVVDVISSPPSSPELNSNNSSQTPKEALFDSFAPGPDKCVLAPRHSKYKGNESRVLVVRRLDFSCDADLIAGGESNVDIIISDDEDEEHCLFQIVYGAIVDAIVSEQMTEHVGMVIPGHDGPGTPKSAPRLSWIAETCPGAPIKSTGKFRNFDLGICKKLEF